MKFFAWVRDLEYRLYEYLYERNPPLQEPTRRFCLSGDDYAFLGRLDKAFRDKEK